MRLAHFALPALVLSLFAGANAACGGSDSGTPRASSAGAGGATASTTTITSTATSATTTSTTTATAGTGGAGGGADAGPDADDGVPSDVYPAPFPSPPQVVQFGGPVLAMPKLVPVFFSNDDPAIVTKLQDFINNVGATQYWAAATTEYGVGAAAATPPVMLMEAAPGTIDDTAIQTWLQGKLDGDDMAWPVNDANTVYVLHYPAGTTITAGGQSSCQSFGGYHSNTALDANHQKANVAYAVVPRCANFGLLSGIDAVTGAESHELLEASTDPYPMIHPAYAQIDNAHFYWERLLGGGEVGDMCAQFPGVFTKFAELDYTVQRSWSNKAAKAGSDPCVPKLPGEVYFNAAPVQIDNVVASVMGQMINVKGTKIAVGASKTIPIEFFSDDDTGGPWTITAKDLSPMPHLDLSLDHDTGVNGEKAQLTIKVMAAGKNNTETFIITSKLGQTTNVWLGIVGN